MDEEHDARVRRLQERINAALRENIEAASESDFSDYVPDASTPLVRRLIQSAHGGGLEGVEAALDEFDKLAGEEDLPRAQHALMIFLAHYPAAAQLGLRIPPLEERSPSQVLPSKRDD
jgi:hypothetical protein